MRPGLSFRPEGEERADGDQHGAEWHGGKAEENDRRKRGGAERDGHWISPLELHLKMGKTCAETVMETAKPMPPIRVAMQNAGGVA